MYKKKWQAARGGREAAGYKLLAAGCALRGGTQISKWQESTEGRRKLLIKKRIMW
jgi:hypothetical protein